ncbi:hypothetical protein GGR51DRAFT_535844 [Nemania sp. FL0031]|nr:hypothetical protein GGR51DRAFT_535844 [Nemania sp. FL0031]
MCRLFAYTPFPNNYVFSFHSIDLVFTLPLAYLTPTYTVPTKSTKTRGRCWHLLYIYITSASATPLFWLGQVTFLTPKIATLFPATWNGRKAKTLRVCPIARRAWKVPNHRGG